MQQKTPKDPWGLGNPPVRSVRKGVFQVERKCAHISWTQEVTVVKCDICGEELENSEALAKHNERMHPMGQKEDGDREMETPAMDEQEIQEPSPMPSR